MPKPKVSTTFNAKNKMKGPLAKMSQQIKRFSKIAIAGAGIALAAVAVGVNKLSKAGDEIAKTARKIDISVEALQELRFAADRSGVSAEAFSDAMKKMNKNIGDLRVNTGMLTTFLNKQNPELKEQLINVKNNEEAFALLTEEISKTENPFDRAALAQAAFGRAGQELIIMMENGTDGIKELREEARKYGNIISTEAAAASEKFVDSLTNLKNAGLSLRNKALGPLIDKLQPLIQRMADFIAENDKLISQGINKTFDTIGKAVGGLVGFFKEWGPLLMDIAPWILGVAGAIKVLNIAMSASPIGIFLTAAAALVGTLGLLEKKFGFGKAIAEEAGGGIFSSEFEENRRRRFRESERGQAQAAQREAAFADPRLLSRNAGIVQSQSTITNQSQLDITMSGFPQGTTAKQKGAIPNMTLNTGFRQAGL